MKGKKQGRRKKGESISITVGGEFPRNKTARRGRNCAASALTTNASKSDKRVSIPLAGFHCFAGTRAPVLGGHRASWKRGKRKTVLHNVIQGLVYRQTLHTDGDGCVLFRATRPFFPREKEGGKKGARRKAEGQGGARGRAEGAKGKKLSGTRRRARAVMDWPGPITSFVSICAEYCS